jgi:ADP-ribose pyrophosphatase
MRELWKRKKREYLYKAKTPDEISVAVDRIALPTGSEFDYVHVDCPYEVVYVVGINERREILLLRQFRYLIDGWIWEVPAGSPNANESLEEGAKREFEEESGFQAGKIEKVGSFYSSVGLTNQYCHVFLASDIRESSQSLEETELITVSWVSLAKAMEMVEKGEIENIGAAYGILLTTHLLGKSSGKPNESSQKEL